DDLAGYFQWDRTNVQKSFIESAHPVAKDVYFNDLASAAAWAGGTWFPNGSVIVKEVTSPDTLQVQVLTTMRKVDGFASDQGDWQYGRFDRTEAGDFEGGWMPVDGAQGCVACHASASDTDFVFSDYIPD
ncbi:MAG: cytochrome P460 family protein, partial [Trueperaceae bacterium]